ncbi:MAG: hypothetical protein ACXWFC_12070 [Nitrososphaeraceae archaeon]
MKKKFPDILFNWGMFLKKLTTNILQKILEGDKSGIYFKVVKAGEIGTNDSINLIKKDNNNNDVTIENIVELITEYKDNKFTYGKSSLRSPKMLETIFS